MINRFGENLKDKVFAVWGLSFKPGTDDVREAPAIYVIKELIKRNYLEYLNLMYRIDVSENKLKDIDISNVNQIVYLILKREWQKVYIRNKL